MSWFTDGNSEPTFASCQTADILEPELRALSVNGLVGKNNSSFRVQIVDIPAAQPALVVEPDYVTDDFARIAVPMTEGRGDFMTHVWQQ